LLILLAWGFSAGGGLKVLRRGLRHGSKGLGRGAATGRSLAEKKRGGEDQGGRQRRKGWRRERGTKEFSEV